MVLVTLFAAALRLIPLTQNRFHPDEALYASFARLIASGRDPLLATVVVDKPPLPFYLMAASLDLFGPHELSARLPNLFASVLSLPLTYALAKRIYSGSEALLSALVLGLSPLAILFSITAFTDPLAAALSLAAILAALHGRWSWSGIWMGLGFASKQSTLIVLPLIVAAVLIQQSGSDSRGDSPRLWPAVAGFAATFLPLALSIFVWDALRRAPIGFWEQGFSDNNPGRLIRANEVVPRLREWAFWLSFITGSRAANIGLLLGTPALLARALARPGSRAAAFDLGLAAYLFAYLGVYWLLAFNIWDRYLLLIAPLVALLLARAWLLLANGAMRLARGLKHIPRRHPQFGLSRLWRELNRKGAKGAKFLQVLCALCLMIIFLVPPALTAAHSGFPVGGDHGAYDGIQSAAAYLQRAPQGSVLYDHWLNWEWNFYLFDAPVFVSWFPDPEALAVDLTAFGHASPRYLVVPSWESDVEVRRAVILAGFDFAHRLTTYRRDGTPSFKVYELLPTANGG